MVGSKTTTFGPKLGKPAVGGFVDPADGEAPVTGQLPVPTATDTTTPSPLHPPIATGAFDDVEAGGITADWVGAGRVGGLGPQELLSKTTRNPNNKRASSLFIAIRSISVLLRAFISAASSINKIHEW